MQALILLKKDTQQELTSRMDSLIADGGNWRWPTAEEIDDYAHADANRNSEALRRRILARSSQHALLDTQDEAVAI